MNYLSRHLLFINQNLEILEYLKNKKFKEFNKYYLQQNFILYNCVIPHLLLEVDQIALFRIYIMKIDEMKILKVIQR
ncbi:hypothetical protein pb186bvf_006585 [Paramecium bursaria]